MSAAVWEGSEGEDEPSDAPGESYHRMPLHMLGDELAMLRAAAGLSQADLARQAGYSQRQVSRWERGDQRICLEAERALLSVLSAAIAEARRYQQELKALGVAHLKVAKVATSGKG